MLHGKRKSTRSLMADDISNMNLSQKIMVRTFDEKIDEVFIQNRMNFRMRKAAK